MSKLKATTLIDSGPPRVSGYRAYVLALALTAIALVVRLPLLAALAGIQPFATFYLSVALSAWWWGTRPSILAALGGLIAGIFFFLEPRLTFEAGSLLPIVVYLFFSTTFIALIRQARKSESASRANVRRVEATEGELQQRRALLDGLAASVLDGILIVSPDEKMIYANDQFQQMWKFPPDVLASNSDEVALKWAETQVADPQAFREGVARAYSDRETAIRGELRMKDGRVFDRYGAPVINKGVHYGWVWTFRDVTEHKQTEEALRESEEHLRTLFTREADTRQTLVLAMEAGHIGTFAWNVVEDRHVWSKETEQFFGYAPGEFSGTTESFLERVHPEDRDWLRKTLYSRFEKRQTAFSSQYRAQRPDGSVTWLSVRGRVDYSSPGVPGRVIGVMVDISAMKQSEEALDHARNQLASHAANLEVMVAERTAKLTETVHELEAFSYSLSHDMRAPLRAMKGFAQILESEYTTQLPPEACGYLKKISRAAGRLDQLIQDVLTYSHILRGQIELKPIDIDKLARQLIEENPALQPPKAVIAITSPCHPVLGHEAYLMQVLSNLVYNAVKFVRPGQLPEIRIWTETVGSEVHLFVKDNGIGIPKVAHERMFGMFQRYHSEKTYEGTGIGLTIVRKATERMGGQVSIESEPGQGSTFRVQLQKA